MDWKLAWIPCKMQKLLIIGKLMLSPWCLSLACASMFICTCHQRTPTKSINLKAAKCTVKWRILTWFTRFPYYIRCGSQLLSKSIQYQQFFMRDSNASSPCRLYKLGMRQATVFYFRIYKYLFNKHCFFFAFEWVSVQIRFPLRHKMNRKNIIIA